MVSAAALLAAAIASIVEGVGPDEAVAGVGAGEAELDGGLLGVWAGLFEGWVGVSAIVYALKVDLILHPAGLDSELFQRHN